MTSAIQATNNSAAGRDDNHDAMHKHLPPDGSATHLKLYNKTWQQGNSPEKWSISTKIPNSIMSYLNFFDTKKWFDLTWKQGILKGLNNARVAG